MPQTARADARLAWTRGVLADPSAILERASTDAGFRSYWRVHSGGTSWIVMDAPPALEDVAPWLAVAQLLRDGGVHVPQVHARDTGQGFLLLGDMGRRTYLDVLDADNADVLFDDAIAALIALQSIAPPATLPRYDRALLERELALFPDWFLARHLGVSMTAAQRDAWDALRAVLVDAALAQPQVLVHRDYMPRNLMHCEPNPGVLDFQDAVVGPIAYDPVCLFRDAFLSWPVARVDAWLARYHGLAHAAGLPVPSLERFREDADLTGAQRHLKVLGIFARLHHRDGKPKYLADAPRFLRYLLEAAARRPALAPLAPLLDELVLPRLAPAPAA
ncbi:aminoglycoside phosphotransferase family protein [Coralloluteibacterium thermophilus]|uniref:Aminoglycoside phosphotransferase family protein n=1 Tax=Coralloluteibacterium thermophilum TaxID=2707049 RepID=A0ABV9NIN8_9GAMM